MAGKPGRSGRKPKPLAAHLLANTYRRDRHGPLPPGGRAAVLRMPAPAAHSLDLQALTRGLHPEGAALVADMVAEYDGWAPGDLRCLRLAAELLDRRSEIRTRIAGLALGQTDEALRLLHAERRSGAEFLAALRAISVARELS